MKFLKNLKVKNKLVLVRCDFNVPLDERGRVLDDFKIVQTLPTIRHLLKLKAKIILMSHLGDPKGKVVKKLRLARVRRILEQKLKIRSDRVVWLENLRFHPEEEKGDLGLAKKLAGRADFFVNDAFASSHRNHASFRVAKFLPSAAGLLLEKEVGCLTRLSNRPKKPILVILGGQAKTVELKSLLIQKMLAKSATILLGNLVARRLKKNFDSRRVIAPVDSVNGFDLGPKTIKLFKEKIAQAKTVFWSGPLGKVEEKKYACGSEEIARAIVQNKAFSIVGGGDTIYFLKKIGLRDKFNYVSTGGDALLLFLSGAKLPGIELLS
jgi:phosphoglycerate kinase